MMIIFCQDRVATDDNDDRPVRAEEHLPNGRLVTVQQYGFDGASRITNKFTAPKMHPASFTTFSGTYDADTDGNLLAMPGLSHSCCRAKLVLAFFFPTAYLAAV